MAKTLFEAIGYRLGQKAAQAKNAFDLMGGSEEESLRAEMRLGRDLAGAVMERTPLIEENDTTRFAAQIGHWLAGQVQERKFPFKILVTAETEPNAFALPGGPIFVSWPLLESCQAERDEIAFLLGHEMAHIVRRHALDRLVRDAALSLLLRQTSGRSAASNWLGKAGRQALTQAYSREEEFEADAFAISLIRNAGGEPTAAERLLERLENAVAGRGVGSSTGYFATHPPLTERLAHLRAKRPA